jgi:hypothetical protein
MGSVQSRIAIHLAIWKIADIAAQNGDVIDIERAASDLLQRHPDCGMMLSEVVMSLEEAAVSTRAAIYSDRTADCR